MTDQAAGLKKLREPFAPNQIGKLPKAGMQLDFVGHAVITARLLDVDPLWEWEPLARDEHGMPLLDEFGGLWIRLTVCGQSRIGYGEADGKKSALAVKIAIGDALRNAGMRFGMALDLWTKNDLEAPPPPAPSDPEMDAALAELGDTCVVLGLNQGDVAGKFYAKHKKPPRKATPEQVLAFIESLHDAADKPIPYSGKVIKTKPLEDK